VENGSKLVAWQALDAAIAARVGLPDIAGRRHVDDEPAAAGVQPHPGIDPEDFRTEVVGDVDLLDDADALDIARRQRQGWFDLMMENQDDLAAMMTLEQGKPLAEAGRDRLRRQLHRVVRRGRPSASTATPSRSTRPTSASS
jgi:hypothetical protein